MDAYILKGAKEGQDIVCLEECCGNSGSVKKESLIKQNKN